MLLQNSFDNTAAPAYTKNQGERIRQEAIVEILQIVYRELCASPPILENQIACSVHSPFQEDEMAKRIKREIMVDGVKRWVTGNSEQEYADNLARLLSPRSADSPGGKHNFGDYATSWFRTYSKPNVEAATAKTYERQLKLHILPVLGDLNVEDVTPDHIQTIFNRMTGTKATKDKARTVLNMILGMAADDGLIPRNPLDSKRLRITGKPSVRTKEYSVEQMQFLIRNIDRIENPTHRAYLALQALHPLRLEEVLGLKWADVDRENMLLHILRAVTHPTRNLPEVKPTKTEASARDVGLSRCALPYLTGGKPEEYVIGGDSPLSYTQVRRMCRHIQRETGFEERITPIRFRTTVLTDIYDQTKDIKQAQAAAGHTTSTMTLKYYVKGRGGAQASAAAIERVYGFEG